MHSFLFELNEISQSSCKKKKLNTVQDIVHSQDFVVVVVVAFFCLEKLYNKTIVDY